MAARVVHLSDEHHAKLKDLAQKAGVPMQKIVEQWIDDTEKRPPPPPPRVEVTIQPEAPTRPEPVTQKAPFELVEHDDGDPYNRPPFWANREVVKHDPTD